MSPHENARQSGKLAGTKPSAKNTIPLRRRAAWIMSDLAKVGKLLNSCGEILNEANWLKVFANVLSSAPAGDVGKRSDRKPPKRWELSVFSMRDAAKDCGVTASREAVEVQVDETLAWRARESGRIGRPHFVPMSIDKIAELLGVTAEIRAEAKAWSLGSVGGSPELRRAARREKRKLRDKQSRRDKGVLERQPAKRPWLVDGVSRSSYYRALEAGTAKRETAKRPTNKGIWDGKKASQCRNKPGEPRFVVPAHYQNSRGIVFYCGARTASA